MKKVVTFDYEDFNTSTRRSKDCRKHGDVEVRNDIDGSVYVVGSMGCSKSRPDVHDALVDYLGGRQLLAYRCFF
jgi:hypothetical protein